MEFQVLSLAKHKNKNLIAIEGEYLKRLKPFAQVTLTEHEVRADSSEDEVLLQGKNLAAIQKKISKGAFIITLDERGRSLRSEELAKLVERKNIEGRSRFSFIIGSPQGVHPELKKISDLTVTLSALTLPYEIARLVLIEQLYRAMSILNKLPYHKD